MTRSIEVKSKKPESIRVIQGDCRRILKTKLHNSSFDFIFMDPPFNIGQDYDGYLDDKPDYSYQTLISEAVILSARRLNKNGVLALHGPDNLVKLYLDTTEELGLHRVAWINWHYRFGQCIRSSWIDSRCHCILYSANPKDITWNPEEVLVESDRASTYGDKRVNETENGGKRVPFTVWGIPSDGPYWSRVNGNSKERRPNHPNQLPEKYLERLIRAYTNPGDKVLDPFGGSGTTAVVAQALKRSCTTIDISRKNCESIRERLKQGAIRV